MDKRLTIFISSVIRDDELGQERLIAKRAVESLKITQPWLFELSSASSENVEDSYLNLIKETNLFIQLLEKNITKPVINEYKAAVRAGIPRLIFIKDVKRRSKKLNDHISNISEKWKEFSTSKQLFKEIQNALIAEIPKLVRLSKSTKESLVLNDDLKDELEIRIEKIESTNVKIAADTVSKDISKSEKKTSNSRKAKIKIKANIIKCKEDFIIAKHIEEKGKK